MKAHIEEESAVCAEAPFGSAEDAPGEEKSNGPSEACVEQLSKEHKKALTNFRDQVRYKDYKGLVKTLHVLESLAAHPEKYSIPEKYSAKYAQVQENILLLKNIVISDIKYSISNDKGLDKSVVILSTLLSEKYVSDVQTSIVTWMSNISLSAHTKELQKVDKLSGVDKLLEKLLSIKDQIGIKTAHLPIWWNISKIVLGDLSVVVKNRLVQIISKGEFSASEYLTALHLCVEFEKTYLTNRNRSRKPGSPQDKNMLRVSPDSPVHLKLLEDISTEKPLCKEEVGENSLSLAFIPHIDVFVKHELASLSHGRLLFLDDTVHSSIYAVYTLLAQTLSKLAYFRFPETGHAFLFHADTFISQMVLRSSFSCADKNFISGVESVSYMRDTASQMLQKLESVFRITNLQAPSTENALNSLENRIYTSFTTVMQKRFLFLNKKVVAERKLYKSLDVLLETLISEIKSISKLAFSSKKEVLGEWLGILGQSLFRALSEMKITSECAEYLLCFMSALEVPVKSAIQATRISIPLEVTIIDRAKIYIKLFLVSPAHTKEFINNFQTMSNGLFDFHQVLEKVSRKHHRLLVEEFNNSEALKDPLTLIHPE
ncbi:hypothetical protein NECID01_1970 [Nematocida sp. AWRm77]|nr:hypothetical protein NECID01_1970 [Nematocida sp. AWRm77]